MDQHEYVAWAQENYEQLLMDPTSDRFEDAHYPWSKKKGNTTIDLHHLDHAIQGIWQSEEEGCRCFYDGHTKAALDTPGFFPLGWMDAYDSYENWAGGRGQAWWHNVKTKKNCKAAECPGDEWAPGRAENKPFGSWWHVPGTKQEAKLKRVLGAIRQLRTEKLRTRETEYGGQQRIGEN